jgi:tRNA-splicing ligase RtcB (3'-phosphate/5'-hydroxy nucleic acid ligase)
LAGSPKSKVRTVPSVDGKAYCFTVPTGFLVLRRNGQIFITGNCGMAAIETRLTSLDLPANLDGLHDRISSAIPAGVGRGHEDRNVDVFESMEKTPSTLFDEKQAMTARTQYGSLGSGNHFVEVCLDERDRVWVVLHSGSRGIGNQLAQKHIKIASGIMKDYFIHLPDPDLAYLAQGTPQFTDYVRDLLWAQEYALVNRTKMLSLVKANLQDFLGEEDDIETDRINCHHNFTQQEQHRGQDLWITRKGAIQARQGQKGIIPGSMGTKSYIVEGLGNSASWESCSHGAGRMMSRTRAKATLSVESLTAAMEGKTWNTSQASKLVDEHPLAYKDIDQVMEDQRDLVRPLHTLSQILNYKGV